MVDIGIALAIWFFAGGVVNAVLGFIMPSLGRSIDGQWGASLWPIVGSLGRMTLVIYLVRAAIDTPYRSIPLICVVVADVLWCLLMMKWTSERWGPGANIPMMKTGVTIGSIIFAVVYFARAYVL
jgi:hypothetical protein